MTHIALGHLMAAGYTPTIGGSDFWTTPLGVALRAFLGVIGLLVVIFTIIRVVKSIATGKIGEAVKAVIGAVILAAFLFQPSLVSDTINAGGTIVSKVIQTVSSIGSGGSGGTNTPTNTPTTPPS